MSIYGGGGLDTALSVFGGGDPLSMGFSLLSGASSMGLFGGGGPKVSSATVRDTISGLGDFIVKNEGSDVGINNDSEAAVYHKPLVDFGDPKEVLGLVLTLVIVTYVYKKVRG